MRLHEAAQALNAAAVGADVSINAVVSDSRKLSPGCLFVALEGAALRRPQLRRQGAGTRRRRGHGSGECTNGDQPGADGRRHTASPRPTGRLAPQHHAGQGRRDHRQQRQDHGEGNAAAILAVDAGADAVLATEGNLNNDIGMPLTLLKLSPEHRYAAIEMGMNHPAKSAI
jgi:UDP-N-acetylmuramoyl-tripeptide--D-alanyl-D-alanine ligase